MRLLFFTLFLGFCVQLRAQELQDVYPIQQSANYDSICARLDAYFAHEYEQEETDCWDNNFVKYERWKWYWRDRTLPDGSFPDLKLQWQEKARQQAAQARNPQPAWTNLGPFKNTGGGYWGMGRTKHVAFHPTDPLTYYVGTPDGGIWKTTDGGATYATVGDDLPYLPVGIILVDYQHPETLYISLGDKLGWWQYNMGVYKSTDGGASWQPTGLAWVLSDFKVIYGLEMSPSDPLTLVAATNSGLMRTTDGGVSWAQIRSGEYTDVKFRPGDGSTLFAAKYDYWGQSDVFKSVDGGNNWTQITSEPNTNNEIRLAVTPANPDYLGIRYSQGKKFFLSTDAGSTVVFKSEMPEDYQFNFSGSNADVVYCGNLVAHRSTDGGTTWTQITNWYQDGVHPEIHADLHHIDWNPYQPETMYFCNDGGIYTFHEPSETWIDHSNGLAIAQFYRIAVSETGGFFKIAAGSQDNGGWLRMAVNSWKHTNGGDAMCQAIDPTNSNVMYTEYYGGNAIYRSTDNFVSSVTISDNLPDDPSGDWVTPFILNPKRPSTLLIGFHDVYRSYNRGDSFEKISNNLTGNVDNKLRDIVMSASDTNYIVASWGSKFYRTLNGGQNWTTHNGPDAANDITRIALHPTDPTRMWISKSGYTAGKKVYRSTYLGNTLVWQNISTGLPNAPVNCVIYDSLTNLLFAGTDVGVYASDADSIYWTPFGTGMPNVWVLDLKIRQVNHTLYAGTHGRGVFSVDLDQLPSSVGGAGESRETGLVYPNPAQNVLYFKFTAENPQHVQLRLLDVNGKEVLRQSTGNTPLGEYAFHLPGLPSGTYVLQAFTEDGKWRAAEKVVVLRS